MTLIVDFEPVGLRVEVEEHQTILEAARTILISQTNALNAPCGGKGLCGRCKVRVSSGSVSPPSAVEAETLSPEELKAGFRLACQTEILGPLLVEIPAESLSGRQDLQVEGVDVEAAVNPAVKRYALRVRPSTISYPRSAWQQVLEGLEAEFGIDGPSIDLSLLRGNVPVVPTEQVLTVTVRDHKIINYFRSYPAPKSLGLAVDLGTTKIAGYLVDLESGSTLTSDAAMNPQIAYGEDVMSRIMYCSAGQDYGERMASLVRECIRDLVQSLVSRIGADSRQVEDAVIVGNTAMHHLFLELPVKQLASSPYIPAAAFPMQVEAHSLGLPLAPGALVYFPPSIAGFVGSDHVAMILGSRIHQTDEPTLGIDIGTNTEIVISTPTQLICCSCASGPAFEGAHVRHGMRAVEGAISEAKWTSEESRLSYRTIGDAQPLGLCGSGVVDAIAELVKVGIIDNKGLFDRDHPCAQTDGDGKNAEFVIVPKRLSGTGEDITITQGDVVAIQLAKAAIRSGTELLLSAAGLAKDDLARVLIAGAFGTRLNLESALSIGLLPSVPIERFENVGNAAGTGARLALISLPERKMAERIARATRYLELTAVPEFSATFARSLNFPDLM
ncbi:MAG: DUF4445 domain-containing protein [Desulfomonile tiedjei]|uniref:DUF4445 domain-containing protein n=1 Tax=Desulfomonile tiedjei TaxID=2358 RepID=A0A9D6Z491_9BACT|nr:DUF4445 domain-containing protein [Desulfomonile tiedjei]